MSKYCHSCGKPVPSDSKFCPECGALNEEGGAGSPSKNMRRTYYSITILGVLALLVAVVYNFTLISKEQKKLKQGQIWTAPTETMNQGMPMPGMQGQLGPSPEVLKEREDELRERLKAKPDDLELNILMGNILYDSQKYGDAIPFYEKAVKMNPKDPDVIVDLGVSYFYLSKFEKAKSLFDDALKINPNHVNALFNTGVVAVRLKKIDLLMDAWGKLIQAAPESPQGKQAAQILNEVHKDTQNDQTKMEE